MTVTFVDTSILCNLLPVPGRAQAEEAIRGQLEARLTARETFILPVTAVIETGNFIAQLPDGGKRRQTSVRFVDLIRLVLDRRAPWTLHEFEWGRAFLDALIEGGGSGMTLIEHATNGVGVGDLCILTERRTYAERARIPVGIWTIDDDLVPHASPWRPL